MVIRAAIVLLLVACGVAAQDEVRRSWYLVNCPITEVGERDGRRVMVTVARGTDHGLADQRRGHLISVRPSAEETANFLGYAHITKIGPSTCRVRVTLLDPERGCRVGDVIRFQCLLPKVERGILWQLARQHIRLRGADGVYSDFESTVGGESRAQTDAVLDRMVARVRESGTRFGKMATLQKALPDGRYKGRKPADLMTGATAKELADFLRYIRSYPGKYLGQSLRVDEAYAGWLMSGAPYSLAELTIAVIEANSDDLRQELLTSSPALRAAVIHELLRRARAGEGDGRALMNIVVRIRRPSDEPAADLNLRFTRAVLQRAQGDWNKTSLYFADTIIQCRKQRSLAPSLRWIEARALDQLGYAFKKLGKFKQALVAYEACAQLEEELGDGLEIRAATTRVIADLLRDQGETTKALAAYDKAIVQFRELDSQERLHEALAGRAQALGQLGRTREAIRTYRALEREHRQANDHAGIARALTSVGGQLWAQGARELAILEYQRAHKLWVERKDTAQVADTLESLSILYAQLGNYAQAKRFNGLARSNFAASKQRSSELIAKADGGWFQCGLGDYPGGLAIMREAQAELAAIESAYGVLFVRNRIAMLHAGRHEYTKARNLYGQSIADARATNNVGALASTLRSQAGISLALRDFESAHTEISTAIKIVHATGALGSEVESRLLLANIESERGDFDRAHKEADKAIALAVEIESLHLQALAHRRKGFVWSREYDSKKAEACFLAAIKLFTDAEVQDRAQAALTMLHVASELHNQGRWEESERRARMASVIAGMNMAPAIQREAFLMRARIRRIRGEFPRAMELLQLVEEQKGLSEWEKAELVLERAKVAQGMGSGELARTLAQMSFAMFRGMRNDWGASSAGLELARILISQGDYAEAAKQVERTRQYTHRTRDFDHVAALENRAGAIALARNDLATAAKHYEAAHATALGMHSKTLLAPYQLKLGRCRRQQGRADDARALLSEAAKTYGDMRSRSFAALCRVELARVALAEGQLEQAQAQLDGIDAADASADVVWQYWYVRSQLEARRGKLDEAITFRKRAILKLAATAEGLGADADRQRRFLLSKVEVYESMAELIGRRLEAETDPAKERKLAQDMAIFVDRARFEVVRAGTGKIAQSGSKVVDKLLRDIRLENRRSSDLRQRMDEARAKGQHALAKKLGDLLGEADKEVARLFDNLYEEDPDFAKRMKFNPKYFLNWRRLDKNARIVIYVPGPTGTHYMVYGPDGFITWQKNEKATEPKLRESILKFHALMMEVPAKSKVEVGRGFGPAVDQPAWYAENCRKTQAELRKLHRWLIEPIREQIKDAEPLILMPYASLCYLPFEALMNDRNEFLCEKHSISYLIHRDHMRLTLERLNNPPPSDPDFWVGFGDPNGELKSSRAEVFEIGAMFDKKSVYTHATRNATELQLYLMPEECTILHFATHGHLNGAKPAETFLQLAAKSPYDGELRQTEIYPGFRDQLECLRSRRLRLVVLSACDTARGAKNPQAEVLGLPDNLSAVGAPAVIGSLWKVDSWSTTSFMAHFYGRLTGAINEKGEPIQAGETKKRMSVGRALRGARLALIGDKATAPDAHPYFWAPFILFGDWR